MILYFTNRPSKKTVMLKSSISSKEVRSYIPLIASVAFVNLSGSYVKDAAPFKNVLTTLVYDFPGSLYNSRIRRDYIIFIIITSRHDK